jgi:hypothetical protein
MLKASHAADIPAPNAATAQPHYVYEPKALPMPEQNTAKQGGADISEIYAPQPREITTGSSDEIIIEFPTSGNALKKTKKKAENEGILNKKKEKQNYGCDSKDSMIRKKPDTQPDVIIGYGSVSNNTTELSKQQEFERFLPTAQMSVPQPDANVITQNVSYETNGALLRLIGSERLPAGIDVSIAEGEIFTVGRYDAAAGRRMSSFEFDRMTKAVSRRHAAIERLSGEYNIIDLASSAGTYIDGQKLPPNTPCILQQGCRVSFGNCGADYIWEQ